MSGALEMTDVHEEEDGEDGRDEEEAANDGDEALGLGRDEEKNSENHSGTASPSLSESERGSNRSLMGLVREMEGDEQDGAEQKRSRPRNRGIRRLVRASQM